MVKATVKFPHEILMLSFFTGGHVLFQQASTCYHYCSSFLLGEMRDLGKAKSMLLFPTRQEAVNAAYARPQEPSFSVEVIKNWLLILVLPL